MRKVEKTRSLFLSDVFTDVTLPLSEGKDLNT